MNTLFESTKTKTTTNTLLGKAFRDDNDDTNKFGVIHQRFVTEDVLCHFKH